MNGPSREIIIPFTKLSDLPGIWVCAKILELHESVVPVRIVAAAGTPWSEMLFELVKSLRQVSFSEVAEDGLADEPWSLTMRAILQSPFDDVLVLAPHTIPLRKPEYLFDDPRFIENGAVLWPRFASSLDRSDVFEKLGLPPRLVSEIDDSQLLISRVKHAAVLQSALEMSRDPSVLESLWGNAADTLKFAFYRTGAAFAGVKSRPQPLFTIGFHYHVILAGMCHFDLDEEQTFQSRKRLPWTIAGDRRIGGGMLEPQCLGFLKELRARLIPWLRTSSLISEADNPWHGEWYVEWQQGYREEANSAPSTSISDGMTEGGFDVDFWTKVQLSSDGIVEAESEFGACFWRVQSWSDQVEISLFDADGDLLGTARAIRDQGMESGEGCIFDGEWSSTKRRFRMGSVRALLQRLRMEKAPQALDLTRPRHLLPASDTLADAVATLFAACALASRGEGVVFHTQHCEWFHRISHPGVAISTSFKAPEDCIGPRGAGPRGRRVTGSAKNLNVMQRHGLSWLEAKCRTVAEDLRPVLPACIETNIRVRRLDFVRYVVIVPFADEPGRSWPLSHWLRLADLLRREGLDVVAIGEQDYSAQASESFGSSGVFWASGDSAEWALDVMLGAQALIGPPGGLALLAALHGIRTLSLASDFPPEHFAGLEMEWMESPGSCAGCRRDPARGFLPSCRASCSALAFITPEAVCAQLIRSREDERR